MLNGICWRPNRAQGLGENDPKLATTLDHLAWVLCSEGKSDKAEPLAKKAR